MKKELLIPVGNKDCLFAAIHNGADAVYLGGKNFGARKYAENFSTEDIIKTINYAHLYNVKVYVTVNTLIKDNDFDNCLSYIEELHKNGVDAIIVQDFGLLCACLEKYPDLELHASTQMHNSTEKGLELLHKLGVKRAVLARELSLSEINKMNVPIEKEIFIHGALCISYSGCCLFSSMIGDRSGNQGSCVGSCRLPYKLLIDDEEVITDEYLLSSKELNTSKEIKSILESSVTTLKVEGRMKSKEYVAFITKYYRNIIDQYYANKEIVIGEKTKQDLLTLFNREFTVGHLFDTTYEELVNIKNPNHLGSPLGNIIKITKDKIIIKLTNDIKQEDGIRFVSSNKGMIVNFLYNEKDQLINKATSGQIIMVDNKLDITELEQVNKTISKELLNEYNSQNEKQIPITIKVKSLINEPFTITMIEGNNTVTKSGDLVEQASNRPILKEDITKQVTKLGNTPFKSQDIKIELSSNSFYPLSKINDLRREVVEELKHLKQKNKQVRIKEETKDVLSLNKTSGLTILVRNENQLKYCLELNVDRIEVTSYDLYLKYKNNNVYYLLPRTSQIEESVDNITITNLSGFASYKNISLIDYTMNVTNAKTVHHYHKLGSNIITLSPELTMEEIEDLTTKFKEKYNYSPNYQVILYGKVDLMVMKYCLLKKTNNCSVKYNKLELEDRMGKKYPVIADNGLNYILNNRNFYYFDLIKMYQNLGINNFKIILYNEGKDEITSLVNNYLDMLK